MDVHLFAQPHVDDAQPGVCRLLFEAAKKPRGGCGDFYLYVWIQGGRFIKSYQALLNEEYALTAAWGTKPHFGTIGRKPFNRTIASSTKDRHLAQILDTLKTLRCDNFSGVLAAIALDASGHAADCELTHSERATLSLLLTNRIKP